MNICNINYTNSFPGAGKTEWAIKQIYDFILERFAFDNKIKELELDLLSEGKSNIEVATAIEQYAKEHLPKQDIILFVAPSHKLLEEVRNRIIGLVSNSKNKIKEKEYISNVIKIIDTELVSIEDLSINDVITLTSRNCNYSNRYAKELDKFSSNTVAKIPNGLLYNPGSVVLITQKAFWAANHDNSSLAKTFWNRARTRVIIDEARSCDMQGMEIKVSADLINELKKHFNIAYNIYKKIPTKIFSKELLEQFRISLSTVTYNQFVELLEIAKQSKSLFIKVSQPTSTSIDTKCTIFFVQVPFAALHGWQRVDLMAAFFEESQLKAILDSAHNIEELPYKFKLKNITSDVIDSARFKRLKAKFKCANFTYVFENNCRISKSLYNNGVVVKSKNLDLPSTNALIKKFAASFRMLKENDSLGLSIHARSVADLLKKCKTNKDYEIYQETFFKKYCPEVIVRHPLDVAIARSLSLTKRFLQKTRNMSNATSLLSSSLIINMPKTLGFGKALYEPYDAIVTESFKQHFRALTCDARGLNAYKVYPCISVLSAFNLNPATSAWFEQYCSEIIEDEDGNEVICNRYNEYLDFSLGQCVQTLMRCSIREAASTDENLIILSTKKMAHDIADTLGLDKEKVILTPKALGIDEPLMIVSTNTAREHYSKDQLSKIKEYNRSYSEEYRESGTKYIKDYCRLLSNTADCIDSILLDAYYEKHYKESSYSKVLSKTAAALSRYKQQVNQAIKNGESYDEVNEKKAKLQMLEDEKNKASRAASDYKTILKVQFKQKLAEDGGRDKLMQELGDVYPKVIESRRRAAQRLYDKHQCVRDYVANLKSS